MLKDKIERFQQVIAPGGLGREQRAYLGNWSTFETVK
jgi:hypothetical protein